MSIEHASEQMKIEEQMLSIRPRAVYHSYLAELVFERAMCVWYWDKIDQGIPGPVGPADSVRLSLPLKKAMDHYKKALELPPPYRHDAQAMDRKEYASDREYIEVRIAEIEEIVAIMKMKH